MSSHGFKLICSLIPRRLSILKEPMTQISMIECIRASSHWIDMNCAHKYAQISQLHIWIFAKPDEVEQKEEISGKSTYVRCWFTMMMMMITTTTTTMMMMVVDISHMITNLVIQFRLFRAKNVRFVILDPDAFMYDAAEILWRTNQRTDKPILGWQWRWYSRLALIGFARFRCWLHRPVLTPLTCFHHRHHLCLHHLKKLEGVISRRGRSENGFPWRGTDWSQPASWPD